MTLLTSYVSLPFSLFLNDAEQQQVMEIHDHCMTKMTEAAKKAEHELNDAEEMKESSKGASSSKSSTDNIEKKEADDYALALAMCR